MSANSKICMTATHTHTENKKIWPCPQCITANKNTKILGNINKLYNQDLFASIKSYYAFSMLRTLFLSENKLYVQVMYCVRHTQKPYRPCLWCKIRFIQSARANSTMGNKINHIHFSLWMNVWIGSVCGVNSHTLVNNLRMSEWLNSFLIYALHVIILKKD